MSEADPHEQFGARWVQSHPRGDEKKYRRNAGSPDCDSEIGDVHPLGVLLVEIGGRLLVIGLFLLYLWLSSK